MEENKISEIIGTSLEKIKELSDTGTVIGEQIKTDNGTVIIPISKVSLGFVSGGVDLACKKKAAEKGDKSNDSFGGGGGAGVSIYPMGFLIIKPNGDVDMLNVTPADEIYGNGNAAIIASLIEKTPDLIKKLKDVFSKEKTPTEATFKEDEE